jgi:hypothetical protein
LQFLHFFANSGRINEWLTIKSGLKIKFIKLNLKMHVKNGDNGSKARYINQSRITFRHYKEEIHWGIVRSARAAKWFSILRSFYFI